MATSLFKVIGGLWPWGSGTVRLPEDGRVGLMTQRPFLPEGPLRNALSYPLPSGTFSDAEIHRALECTGLAWLPSRLNESNNWEEALPLLVLQRLGFARILLQRPGWVIMEDRSGASPPSATHQEVSSVAASPSNRLGVIHNETTVTFCGCT